MRMIPVLIGGSRFCMCVDDSLPWKHRCYARNLALIYFKARHHGSSMPTDELIDAIWGSHGPWVTANVPAKHVETVKRLFVKEVTE